MNDKEYEKQKKRVTKLFNKWRSVLGLGWWKVTMEYARDTQTGELNYAPPSISGKFDCTFSVTSDYYYKTAVITAYLPTLERLKDEDLERYFIHECMHIQLKPMQTKEKAAEEELVATSLADVVLWIVEATKKKQL